MPCKKAKKSGGIKTASCQLGLCYLKRSKMVILPKARTQLKTKNAIPAFLSAAKRNFFKVTPPLSR